MSQSVNSSGHSSNSATTKPITILVLGDEAVGKSSLISTYVSRHFTDGVPGIMTRVRLPPEPISGGEPNSSVITTIVDSQSGDSALVRSMSTAKKKQQQQQKQQQRGGTAETAGPVTSSPPGIEHVDSIILVYDLNRVETFYRLENHWLPLIERCYNGEVPVIVAGNKMDLFRPSSSSTTSSGITNEQALARSRQQISSLLQRFKFVLQWIKCSAKNLLHIDEVFIKAQQAVLYPITPLYDLSLAQLTPNCRRALTRIFRMCDRDSDGLLSNVELDLFQRQAFPVRLAEGDFTGWQKVVPRNINNNTNEPAVVGGKFTVAGFLAIFEVFITQNRLESPWRALRTFGYDDNLNLKIPSCVMNNTDEQEVSGGNSRGWELSSSARTFLKTVFEQFDSDNDGFLSTDDIENIFSIIPEPSLPPWHPSRASRLFGECFSLPNMSSLSYPVDSALSSSMSSSLVTASGIPICSGASLPSVDMSSSFAVEDDSPSTMQQPMSFLDWMGYWHMVSAISPSVTRTELYRLGHVEIARPIISDINMRHNRRRAIAPISSGKKVDCLPSFEVRTLVLGNDKYGETSRPQTNSTHVKIKRTKPSPQSGKADKTMEDLVVYILSTELSTYPYHQWKEKTELASLIFPEKSGSKLTKSFDLVVLTFDCTKPSSLLYAIDHEALLTEETPRVFVATNLDETEAGCTSQNMPVLEDAIRHCKNLDIEPPLLSSATSVLLGSKNNNIDEQERTKILDHIARCAPLEKAVGFETLRSRPQAEKNRRDAARRRKMTWLAGVASIGLTVVLGIGFARGGHPKASVE